MTEKRRRESCKLEVGEMMMDSFACMRACGKAGHSAVTPSSYDGVFCPASAAATAGSEWFTASCSGDQDL